MNERSDDDLRERFAALRREESSGSPAFRSTLAAAQPRPRRQLALAAAVAFVVAAVLIFALGIRHRTAVDLAGVRVHAPTDFLLRLPGADLLRTVPQLGRVSFDRRTL